jgi:PRC-barrel domain
MMKRTLGAVGLALVLATPAFAQQSKPMAPVNTDTSSMAKPATEVANKRAGFVQTQNANEWRGSKLIGASVYGPSNDSIGDINDVIIGSGGEVKAVVVGVGGFLGVGEKNVALPFDALTIARKADSSSIQKITVSYTKDELKNAPKFAYYEASKSATTGEGSSGMMKPATTPKSDTMKK